MFVFFFATDRNLFEPIAFQVASVVTRAEILS